MIQISLAQRIQQLVADMPEELIVGLAVALQKGGDGNWAKLKAKATHVAKQPSIKQHVIELIDYWRINHLEVTTESVALALMASAQVADHYRQSQQLEIVWTGPDSQALCATIG